MIEIRTLKSLTAHGVRLAALSSCIQSLRVDLATHDGVSIASLRLVTDGKTVFRYVPEKSHLESLDQYGQFAFAFGIGDEAKSLSKSAKLLDRHSRYSSRMNVKSIGEDINPIDEAKTG